MSGCICMPFQALAAACLDPDPGARPEARAVTYVDAWLQLSTTLRFPAQVQVELEVDREGQVHNEEVASSSTRSGQISEGWTSNPVFMQASLLAAGSTSTYDDPVASTH
jgi:hypothetical protein